MSSPSASLDNQTANLSIEEQEQEAQRVINEEYKTWKKNSPFLYDMVLSTALEWPTLTVEWFPDVKEEKDKPYNTHRLLIGTHTSNDVQNQVQIAEVQIPKVTTPNAEEYDEEKEEIGGYGKRTGGPGMKFNVVHRINHPGEVNKARINPLNPDQIATMAIDGRVLIFDRSKLSVIPGASLEAHMELHGHEGEGFGLCWSPHELGQLASGSEDKTMCLWDLNDYTTGNSILSPKRRYTHHDNIVNDVQFHPVVKSFIGTVSDDLTLKIVDLREASNSKAALVAKDGHVDAINALAWNPHQEVLVATASGDKTIGLWDIRNVKQKVHTFTGHEDAVTSLQWHPTEAGVLGSGSYDRRILFWDLSRIGDEQLPEDAEDGPPELLFMHGGHTNHLADFSWNKNEPWLVASAAEDNLLQVWKVASQLITRDEGDIPLEDME
ncbi:Histone acetyltransferase type B subunit 2 [Ceratocystis fimbriata CBS 114723]|uniref:Histone acetyltransferase type B subunit 2 n=2 Tax=Ceratocystis TaxID=5157 RepID=A0A0F8DKR5_CERFI|nr:Histone acetyltransferase type B subunit 2 [Ceratocystis platani]PHH55867.1 Histone acetyltransferase type B subunit 2 [Ceratocystis fimbriata CBS 114723]